MGHYAGHVEKGLVNFFRVRQVLAESPFRAVALCLSHFGFDRGIIPAVSVFVKLGCEFLAYDPGEQPGVQPGDVADGVYTIGQETLFCLLAYPKQVPDAQRPHLFFDFILP